MAEAVLSDAELGRATLARQLLLERSSRPLPEVVAQVVSLQAQFPRPVHGGLWTRAHGVTSAAVNEAVAAGALVRATLMRHTLHVATAADYLAFRAVVQPGVARAFEGMAGARVAGLDRAALLAAVADRFAAGPATMKEIRDLLDDLVPGGDSAALGYLARTYTQLVQQPTGRGWGWAGAPVYRRPRDLLGADPQPDPDPRPLIRRYLAAFGPASVRDVTTWSGLSRLGPVVAGMDDLVRLRAASDGRELLDVAGAPRPDAGVPAPPRLLPEFDNVVVAHADRTRLMSEEHRRRVSLPAARVMASFLVDGRIAGTWTVAVGARVATLTLAPFARLDAAARAGLLEEAEGMARLYEPAARDWRVVIAPPA